jgi:anti-sigma regulatory factor (Ser/Thr protein kinase)
MTIKLTVPRIYHSSDCCHALFKLWQTVNQQLETYSDLTLDFQKCKFLSHIGVAFLGGLAHHVRAQGGQLNFDVETLKPEIRMNLAQNGFLFSLGAGPAPWSGNSIPYRNDDRQDSEAIMTYLLNHWLSKGWVSISSRLQEAIAGQVWELYANAFEHSHSPIGVFSCGQHYPKKKELHLTIIDFGQGIPTSVQSLSQNAALNSSQALEWAFQSGTSTASNGVSRGTGLNSLQSFVLTNRGNLKIFSNDGYVNIKDNEVKYGTRAIDFGGTLINIAFKCDESYYCFASEVQDTDRKWF